MQKEIHMSFLDLLESNVTIYHGDNHKTKKINVNLMNNGNNQEGIGIYFGNTIDVAQTYGKNIVKATIDKSKFVDSRKEISIIGKSKIKRILKELYKVDSESMYYLLTDYGVEVYEPEEVEGFHIDEGIQFISDEEVRNFQIDMVERFNLKSFVEIWNRVTKIDGTYQKQTPEKTWYCVINPKIKLETV